MIQANGSQDMGHFETLAHATRPTRHGDSVHIAEQQLPLALDELGGKIQISRNAIGARFRAVELDVRNIQLQSLPKPFLQRSHVRNPLCQPFPSNFCGHSATHDSGNILGASPPPPFLHPAMNHTDDAGFAIAVEHANPFGTVEPMGRETHHGRPPLLHIDGQPPGAGLTVHIKGHVFGGTNLPHLTHRLNSTDVVVHMVHRHKHRLGRDGCLEFVQPNHPLRRHTDSRASPSLLFQEIQGVHHTRMLRRGNHQVLALALVRIGRALDG